MFTLQQRRQQARAWRLMQRHRAQLGAKLCLDAPDQPHRQQRMPPLIVKPRIHGQIGLVQNIAHQIGNAPRQGGGRRRRISPQTGTGHAGRNRPGPGRARGGQGGGVDLAACGAHKAQNPDQRRAHMGGQFCLNHRLQRRQICLCHLRPLPGGILHPAT